MQYRFNRFFFSAFALMIGGQVAFASTACASPMATTESSKAVASQPSATAKGSTFTSQLEDLDLTEAQAEEIEAIQANTQAELSEILSAQQLETLATAQANGDDMRSVVRGLGLNSSQRSAFISVMRDMQSQISDVLTPEQQAQLEGASPRDRN